MPTCLNCDTHADTHDGTCYACHADAYAHGGTTCSPATCLEQAYDAWVIITGRAPSTEDTARARRAIHHPMYAWGGRCEWDTCERCEDPA